MSTIINARSPYYIKYSAQSGTFTQVQLDVRIWNGILTTPPTAVTYTITKTPLQSTTGNYVAFEISELIRDYLETEYYNLAVDAVWVKVDYTQTFSGGSTTTGTATYLGLDGFGYFQEGINPRTNQTPMVLQSNLCINFVKGRDIRIPVFSEAEPTIVTTAGGSNVWNLVDKFWEAASNDWDTATNSQDVVDSNISGNKIQYVILTSDFLNTGETITVTSTVGPSQQQVLTLNEICEPKFEPIRGIFYNKWGALQSYWFSKKSTVTTSTKSENFKRNTIDFTGTPAYSIYKHNKQRFNVVADQKINVNTPLQGDCLNEPLEQMIMSEYIWLEDESSTKPVLIKTESVKRLTGVNDKMIQYSVDFDYAYSKINMVR
jgi:hypothetical protein